jgi:hypothetical protein
MLDPFECIEEEAQVYRPPPQEALIAPILGLIRTIWIAVGQTQTSPRRLAHIPVGTECAKDMLLSRVDHATWLKP